MSQSTCESGTTDNGVDVLNSPVINTHQGKPHPLTPSNVSNLSSPRDFTAVGSGYEKQTSTEVHHATNKIGTN